MRALALGTGLESMGVGYVDLFGAKMMLVAGMPGWPPRRHLPRFLGADFGGLTISEEGGLELLNEFRVALASCSCV